MALLVAVLPEQQYDDCQAVQQQCYQQCKELQAAAAALVAQTVPHAQAANQQGSGSSRRSHGEGRCSSDSKVGTQQACGCAVGENAGAATSSVAGPCSKCANPATKAAAAAASVPKHLLHGSFAEHAERLSQQLTACGAALCTAVPSKGCCNYPGCDNYNATSEQQLVGGSSTTCSGCRTARYCCRQHQQAHWKQHKPVCRMLAAQRQAAASG